MEPHCLLCRRVSQYPADGTSDLPDLDRADEIRRSATAEFFEGLPAQPADYQYQRRISLCFRQTLDVPDADTHPGIDDEDDRFDPTELDQLQRLVHI